MPNKQMPWTSKVLEVLDDLEPHSIDELAEICGPIIPPGRAARAAEKGRRNSSTSPTRVRPTDEVAVGRRALVVVAVRSLRVGGHVTVDADGGVRLVPDRAVVLERALRDLVVATGRLAAGDAPSDVLYGILDMRTRACGFLGIETSSGASTSGQVGGL